MKATKLAVTLFLGSPRNFKDFAYAFKRKLGYDLPVLNSKAELARVFP